ncbi:MAG TPA: peptide ABC transporter ATP-binding protein [Lactobacillus sp.]|nr:peptide ABC transporter ATP-binding protein [Lactobacillus sp.]
MLKNEMTDSVNAAKTNRHFGRIQQGIALSVGSQMLWGIAGNFGQFLFTKLNVSPTWMVVFRLLMGGIILLSFAFVTEGHQRVMAIWHHPKDVIVLVLFSVFAMLGIQLTYFMTISYSNAATATVLQFTAPVIVITFLALRYRQWPSRIDTITVIVAVIGTFLLITNGNPRTLDVSLLALVWGIMTAGSDAVYILLPNHILKQYGPVPVVAWSFLIGGLALNFFKPVWHDVPKFSWSLFWIMAFMVILGTVFAYLMELQSIPLISAQLVAILQAVEPITATLVAVLFMGTRFTVIAGIGIVLVIATVFIQAVPKNKMTTKD